MTTGIFHAHYHADSHDSRDTAAVTAQVLEQFAIYGPRSRKQEYFGFVYSLDGALANAVVRGNACRGHDACRVNTKPAAERIPPRAKVLGEWHTHPHVLGAGMLSIWDVRGAGQNAHIHCYASYYAASNGKVYSWNPRSTSVPTAMASRTELGSYWDAINRDSGVRFAFARG